MKKITKRLFVALLSLTSMVAVAQTQTLQVQINSSTDDAEEKGANTTGTPGDMDLTSSDIELVNDGSDGDQFIGLRFANMAIPQGAIISSAYIQFTVDEIDNSPGSVIFKIEDADSTTTFSSTNSDISSRPVLNDSVVWSNIPAWLTAGDAGADQATPDLSSLIQAIVNRSGWKSGNALNIIATGTGERTAEAYDGTSSSAAVLVVQFTAPVTSTFAMISANDDAEMDVTNGAMDLSSSDLELTTDGSSIQLVGTRFQNVNIPAGSIIQEAYIQFTVDEVNTTGDVDVMIALEDADNAAAITTMAQNLSNRNFTDSIIWNNIPGWNTIGDAGSDQRTPNFAAQLQQVVNRSGWNNGNAILVGMIDPAVLSVSGYTGNTGKRVAQTYDNSASTAPKLVVTFIPPAIYQNGTFPVAKLSSWKFDDSNTDLSGTNWKDVTYADASWSYGDAILGYGNSNETTLLSNGGNASAVTPTYYLRHTFDVQNAAQYDSLVFDVLRDDGVIVYVNGVEAFRQNMPSGSVTHTTLATATVGNADETTYFRTITANLLQNGLNVIAVELHQATAGSSDLSFDMEIGFKLPPLSPATYPLAKESDWHYLDNGASLDAVAWTDTLYNDDNWAQGQGPLGYGDPMNTEISFGPDANNKFITYYFRREMMVDTAAMGDTVQVGMRLDDGAVVYINGVEVIRVNLPAVSTSDSTAINTISGSAETTYFTYNVPKSAFRHGKNSLAVEVHNRDIFSSDLGFDMYLKDAPVPNPPASGCANGNGGHIACFTSIMPTGQTSNMLIPTETHTFQLLFKQGEQYTDGNGTVPGNHDFTGFVPMNGSSTLGHLSINHENNPGGVSMLDIHYNDSTNLWVMDTSKKVDFFTPGLVTTNRNCSGGVTPWGTIITAEETTTTGDANNDGYDDVGWLVEIDPLTAEVMDYDNDGIKDKLWAMGRMGHENVVVANDSVTAYYGEDGGTHCVFKFVANQKGNLSAGTTYVLKLDQPLAGDDPSGTTATWVQVPNTTQADRNNIRNNAAALGGTNFNGVEDVEINPITGQIYFTAKGRNRVYRFTDNGTTITNFQTFVGGASYILNTSAGVFTEPWGSGNDNLTFDDQGNLWVLQDGGKNYIWLVRPDHTQAAPKVELFASMPAGSEPTGLTFTPDYKFGFFSVQHPSGSNTFQIDATGDTVYLDKSATVVFSRNEYLGVQAPIAGFKADTTVIKMGNSVVFTDTSANHPTSRMWTFNGGSPATSTNKNETVTYASAGFYTTVLEVYNAAGSDTATYTQYIEVLNVVGIEEDMLGSLNVYPNPTAGNVTVHLDLLGGEDVHVELYDLSARKLADLVNEKATGGATDWKFNLSHYASNNQSLILMIKVDEHVSRRIIQLVR